MRICIASGKSATAADDNSHFHVVIENISDRPQNIIDEANSWGYYNVSFEYVMPAGERKVMEKVGRGWGGNSLTTTTLQPGEVSVRDIYLTKNTWTNLPLPERFLGTKVRIQAIFEQKPPEEVDAWQGRITSAEQEITFYNGRQQR